MKEYKCVGIVRSNTWQLVCIVTVFCVFSQSTCDMSSFHKGSNLTSVFLESGTVDCEARTAYTLHVLYSAHTYNHNYTVYTQYFSVCLTLNTADICCQRVQRYIYTYYCTLLIKL